MKLESLFALYLYQHKILNLPGIGSFTAENTIGVPEDNEKHPATVQGISFTNKNITEPDAAFIDFLKLHTGKMRPLAISDLESYLMLSKQFLNIGKQFHIEGIGTLQKINDGSLKFTPGEYSSARLSSATDDKSTVQTNATVKTPQNAPIYKTEEKREYLSAGNSSKKAFLLLAGIITILLIGWGGYYLFKNNTTAERVADSPVALPDIQVPAPDSSGNPDTLTNAAGHLNDSLRPAAPDPGTYKFILETTSSKTRALKRFSDLISYRARVKMETADSVRFVIFTQIKATPKDTGRIKDSLNAWYYGTPQMKVSIAQ